MPRFTTPDGRTVYVPGVYSDIRVVSDLPGPLPEFHIPVIVGTAEEAHYTKDFASAKQSNESDHIIFAPAGTSSAAETEFGTDSDIAIAMRFAKRHGLPWAYIIAANALTRAKVTATSTGPVTQGVIYSKKFGAPGNHIALKIASGTTVTITPVKRFSMLTVNAASGASRLYVKDVSWIKAGDSILIGDNNSTDASYVVDSVGSELNSAGQIRHYIVLTSNLAAAIDTAQYGLVFQYDAENQETPDAFASVQEMVDWFNEESKYLGFTKDAGFTNPASLVALATSTPLKEIAAWGAVTVGTSPASVAGDHTTLITTLDASAWDAFAVDQQVIPQAFLVLDSSSTVHGSWRDWATAKRTEGSAVSVTVGCAWGDIVVGSGTDTDPGFRATALNSDNVMLCGGGLDKIAAYLSLAPSVFGRRIEGGVGHNLTNDDLIYSEVEKQWDERNSGHLTTLHKKGVVTYRLSTSGGIRFRISQGLTTLQNNAASWVQNTAQTPLAMQRDLADFADRVVKEDLDGTQVGADEVDESTISTVVVRRAQKSLLRRGYIKDFRINSITLNENGAGYDLDWAIKLPVTNDYMGVVTNIQIGG